MPSNKKIPIPWELNYMVASFLNNKDLSSLARTSREYHDGLTPSLERRALADGGRTILTRAANDGNITLAQYYLTRYKLSVDIRANNTQPTALHYAAFQGYEEIVRLLLDHGADTECEMVGGNYILWPLVNGTTHKYMRCAGRTIHIAVKYGHTKVVRLLIERGADKETIATEFSQDNARKDNYREWSLMYLAAVLGHVGVMQVLTDLGVDPNQRCMSVNTQFGINRQFIPLGYTVMNLEKEKTTALLKKKFGLPWDPVE